MVFRSTKSKKDEFLREVKHLHDAGLQVRVLTGSDFAQCNKALHC